MKNNAPDPYEVLHITPTATPGEVARAYRLLMRSQHPDTRAAHEHNACTGSTPPELYDIMAAYAILGNPEKRAAYEQDHPHTNKAPPPPQQPEPRVRQRGHFLPAASLAIGPVLWEPTPRWSSATAAGPRPALPLSLTVIWRIRH
jgi:hypothetical protein